MRITGHTAVFALLGDPVAHSRSPDLHNAWFDHHGIDGAYVALQTRAGGPELARALRALGLRGANLTVPLKTSILPHLDTLDEAARACRAVNTVTCDAGRLHGYNTDADGFLQALLADGIDPAGRRVAILGAGGAARAVAWAVHARGPAAVRIFNRTRAHADALIADLSLHASVAPLDADAFGRWPADLVIQTLPGPARPTLQALPTAHLDRDAAWCDLNYWDADPPHREQLRARGVVFQTGHAMLLHQAARAFLHFTGTRPALRVGLEALARKASDSA